MAKQSINTLQRKENTARYYGYQTADMTTTSATYVNFTPSVSITTTGGVLEMEVFVYAKVSAATAFFALSVNSVDYEVITLSNTAASGFYGKIKSNSLPAGTYTVQLRGKINSGATLSAIAYQTVTIFVKEVNAG